MREELEVEHLGEWVVVHGGKLIGTYEDFKEAAGTALKRFGRGPYLIKGIGEPPLSLPASLLYRPIAGFAPFTDEIIFQPTDFAVNFCDRFSRAGRPSRLGKTH